MIRNSAPASFMASGLSDSLDQSTSFPGACTQLSNFVFDRINRRGLTCRPGVGNAVTTFSAFTSPSTISVMRAVGTRIYGMIASGLNPGFDEPFCYDTSGGGFVTISGVTSSNVPSTLTSVGPWTPPTMDVISSKIIVTHVGFNGTGTNFFGIIDISNPDAPAWSSSNTSGTPLSAVPTAVAQFFNRAWFVIGNLLFFSDSLAPTSITNASQFLTLGDTSPITAVGGVPISTATEGIIQALIAFKGAGKGIWQITGDVALSTLALNELSGANGTDAPRSLVAIPSGLAYLDSDGVRVVSPLGSIGFLSPDIVQPFLNSSNPTRAVSAYANSVFRICLDTSINGVAISGADFWFDFLFSKWNGWHSFTYHCAIRVGSECFLSSNAIPAQIFSSSVVPDSSSVYLDNGSSYSSVMESSYLPLERTMNMKSIIESTIEVEYGQASSYTISLNILDENGNLAGSASINTTKAGSNWGQVIWGQFLWAASSLFGRAVQIPWQGPVVFADCKLRLTLNSQGGVNVKRWMMRMQELNALVYNS